MCGNTRQHICSEDKHPDCCAEHQQRGDSDDDAADQCFCMMVRLQAMIRMPTNKNGELFPKDLP
jgi:hypothetical protein